MVERWRQAARRLNDSPYVASILSASTDHEAAKPAIKVMCRRWGSGVGGDSNAYPTRFGTRRVQALTTVRQLVQGVPSEGAAAIAGYGTWIRASARGRTGLTVKG